MNSSSSRFPVIILILISLALLIPGITGPMLTMNGTIENAALRRRARICSWIRKGEISAEEKANAVERARGTVNMAMGMLGVRRRNQCLLDDAKYSGNRAAAFQ